jgi:hypothetical protein
VTKGISIHGLEANTINPIIATTNDCNGYSSTTCHKKTNEMSINGHKCMNNQKANRPAKTDKIIVGVINISQINT